MQGKATPIDDVRAQPGAYLQDIRGTLFVSNTFAYVPKPLMLVMKNLPIPVVRRFVGTAHRIRQTGRQLIATYRSQEAEGKGLPNGTIFDHFVSAKGDKLVMTESQREAEGRSLLIAGGLFGRNISGETLITVVDRHRHHLDHSDLHHLGSAQTRRGPPKDPQRAR